MSVKDSESRRFESKIGLSFSQADVGATSAPDLLFNVCLFQVCKNKSKHARRKRVQNNFGWYFGRSYFFLYLRCLRLEINIGNRKLWCRCRANIGLGKTQTDL